MPARFKIGDRVICKKGAQHFLIEGKIYTIIDVNKIQGRWHLHLKEKPAGLSGWLQSRFVLYQNGLEKALKYASKI